MKSTSSIRIIHEHELDRSATRFVAALCFMEFYTSFVCYGVTIWNTNGNFYSGPLSLPLVDERILIPLLASTAFIYLCGRGLWRDGHDVSRWLCVGIFGLFSVMLLEATVAATDGMILDFNASSDRPGNVLDAMTPQSLLAGTQAAFFHFPLFITLIVLWLVTRLNSRWHKNDKALWTYCAAAYSLAWVIAAAIETSLARMTFDPAMPDFTNVTGSQYAIGIVDVALLMSTAIFLLRGSRFARSTALMMATVNTVAVVTNWFILAWLVNISIDALMYRIPFATSVEQPHAWTKHDFMWLFVLPAFYVLPWLLIAGYAWRVPMRKPPDDGTPFPRRYCAKCLYSLYGNKSDRCPECGCLLTEDHSFAGPRILARTHSPRNSVPNMLKAQSRRDKSREP